MIDFKNIEKYRENNRIEAKKALGGLPMFGNEFDIVREYNNYFLDYQEQSGENALWEERIISSSGDWSGNVYDFYFRVYDKLTQNVNFSQKTEVHQALREALANCLINAEAKTSEIAEYIDLKPSRTRIYLNELISGGIVVTEGGKKNRRYKLKA